MQLNTRLNATPFVRFLVSAGIIRLDQARAFGPQAGIDFFTQLGFDLGAASGLASELMDYALSMSGTGTGTTSTGVPVGTGTGKVSGPIPIGPIKPVKGPGAVGAVAAAGGGTAGGPATLGGNPFPAARLVIGVNGYPVVKRT